MKKLFLTSALALAVTAGSVAPAHAGETVAIDDWETPTASWSTYGNSFSSIPFVSMIALLLPAVQAARPAR